MRRGMGNHGKTKFSVKPCTKMAVIIMGKRRFKKTPVRNCYQSSWEKAIKKLSLDGLQKNAAYSYGGWDVSDGRLYRRNGEGKRERSVGYVLPHDKIEPPDKSSQTRKCTLSGSRP